MDYCASGPKKHACQQNYYKGEHGRQSGIDLLIGCPTDSEKFTLLRLLDQSQRALGIFCVPLAVWSLCVDRSPMLAHRRCKYRIKTDPGRVKLRKQVSRDSQAQCSHVCCEPSINTLTDGQALCPSRTENTLRCAVPPDDPLLIQSTYRRPSPE